MFKTIWVDSHSMQKQSHIVDGERFSRDIQTALNDLASTSFDVVSITPVISGRYAVEPFDSRKTTGIFPVPTVSPDTCASWGYSMTDGVVIVARKS